MFSACAELTIYLGQAHVEYFPCRILSNAGSAVLGILSWSEQGYKGDVLDTVKS